MATLQARKSARLTNRQIDISLCPRLTADEKALLSKGWDRVARSFMERDGTDNDPAKRYNVKDNPVLAAAILKIRDGYFELFNEKRHFLQNQPRNPRDKIAPAIEDDHNFDLYQHNYASHQKLMMRRGEFKISLGHPHSIIGSIIRSCLVTFENVFKEEGTPRMFVPSNIHPCQKPEENGCKRNVPRKTRMPGL